ncbi:MAG: hypothetical protein LH606_07585 [Cytophagaceae bacterium]|nr:hypothetical protein [Cytophagaceae bacterium]
MKNVLTDTGFWIALFEERKQPKQHELAVQLFELLDNQKVFVPWPVVYETMRTSFVHESGWVQRFVDILNRPEIHLIEDDIYRQKAVDAVVEKARRGKEVPSLVDALLHQIILDDTYRFDHLFTFNLRDFYEPCRRRKIEINL